MVVASDDTALPFFRSLVPAQANPQSEPLKIRCPSSHRSPPLGHALPEAPQPIHAHHRQAETVVRYICLKCLGVSDLVTGWGASRVQFTTWT